MESNLIGLDGAWGSGKSNLVKILELKLADTHHFFVYDAWGHQEDLQRRSFLEELTADLRNYDIVNSGIWNKKLKDLLSKKRETFTKTIPRLSYGVIITILVAVFTPIARTIAEVNGDPAWKIFITLIPVLIGAVAYLIASGKARHLLSVSDVYAVYKDKELSNETYVTISEKDILEQVVEEDLIHKGYFVQHSIKFLPRRDHPDFVRNQRNCFTDSSLCRTCLNCWGGRLQHLS